ncbi:MAG: DUF4350 domain-containing protein [Lutibacter sp.]|uniref:DUF4350 domain-containing protein n=1 Tax=Lutibacter sp. TaxID=1925666 RepID=UPI00299D16C4|nr:DUF4350 domain-containing protein [Lutibacter sp.]MDX1828329.1 DUF4350 domain-containing protein [Lutibacter sp.]
MDKASKIYLTTFILLILGFIYIQSTKKKPINWFPSYVAKHKIPYGTYVLKEELPKLFPSTKIKNSYKPPYLYLKDSTLTGTYFFVDDAINFGKAELYRLLNFVKRGNDVFIATHGINIDTLGFKTKRLISKNLEDKVFFKFNNKVFNNKEFYFDKYFDNQVFTKIDTANTTVLGFTGYLNNQNKRTEKGVNFVKYKYGKGNFYFYTFPEVFTNYTILNSKNTQQTANVLSYIRSDIPIIWDTYYKTGKTRITSPIHYLLSSKSLKYAYYVMLLGVLFFVVFKGKRTQRSIPIITPLKNQTLAFTQTIANMYFEEEDHKNIAEQKINYFLDYIRTTFHIQTTNINEEFYTKIASRSGNSFEFVQKIFLECDSIHFKNTITKEELIALNKNIEKFKNKNSYGK